MKREHMIERLATVGHNRRELNNLGNANIRVIYEQSRPVFERRAAEVQRIAQMQARNERKRKAALSRIQDEQDYMRRQEIWMRRCVKVPVPPIRAIVPFQYPKSRPVLTFGLAELVAYARNMLSNRVFYQDAVATLRVLRS